MWYDCGEEAANLLTHLGVRFHSGLRFYGGFFVFWIERCGAGKNQNKGLSCAVRLFNIK